ncbi:MAG TPA: hypothetical protein VHD90_18250 [Phototrophicaceae bacterium]|nr:hypothetical protein [Phototrophicaceae bacterium]
MKRVLAACAVLVVLSAVGISFVNAQNLTLSSSVPHEALQCALTAVCPPTPTPGGSGHNSPHNHSGDEDGDGIPDGIDQCPNDGGPSSNQGCPIGANLIVQPTQFALPLLPNNGVCLMATRTDEPVYLHDYPSRSALNLDLPLMDPAKFYPVADKIVTTNGSIWYATNVPSTDGVGDLVTGYALSTVVRLNQDCANLSVDHWPSMSQDMPQIALPQNLQIVLKPNGLPSLATQAPGGDCSSSFGIDNGFEYDGSNANQPGGDSGFEYGGLSAIHFSFGIFGIDNGLPNSGEGCVKLDADGHGFGILPPDTNALPFALHFSIGYPSDNPNQLALIAQLLPSNQPDANKVGVSLLWDLPSDPSAALNFGIDWTQAGAAHPGIALSWNNLPPDPCKPGDTSCAANSGKQGVLFGLLPAVQGSSNLQPTAYFFPNGFDPSIGGFTQIEHQPNGSNPGDQYGFTQIERGSQIPQVTLHFSQPTAP